MAVHALYLCSLGFRSEWWRMPLPMRLQSHLKVAELFDNDNLTWNMQELNMLCRELITSEILAELGGWVLTPGIPDKIMFTWANSGEFSVKGAYQMLTQLQPLERLVIDDGERDLWKKIDLKIHGVPPRVRMFFWRLINGALPTAEKLSKRIHKSSRQNVSYMAA